LRNPYDLWLNQVSESDSTSRRYLQDIRQFEKWAEKNHGLVVEGIPGRWRQAKYAGEAEREKFLDELRDIANDYFVTLKKSYSNLSVNRSMSVVMSFLHHFDIPIKPIRIRHPYVVYHNRDITKDEIRSIMDHSDVRNRAMYFMLYESGMRPGTLVNLRFKHIKGDFLARKVPMKIDLTADILKCRVSDRWVFIGDEGFQALTKYLALRLPLEDDELVFRKEKTGKRRLIKDKMESGAVSQAFNKTVNKLRLSEKKGNKPKDLRLYCLRKAFRKFMATGVDQAYVEFWMGHTSTATHYLSHDVEHHRALYAKGYANLRLHKPEGDEEAVANLAKENLALKEELGKLKAEVGRLDSNEMKKKLEEQNEVIQKMQGQIDLMLQGLVEKDRQYFELKHPLLKGMDKTEQK
jgi:integrase